MESFSRQRLLASNNQPLLRCSIEKVNRPSYFVRLKTEKTQTGDSGQDLKLHDSIEFNCSVEEMLDLTNKLRDAVKQIDRIAGDNK